MFEDRIGTERDINPFTLRILREHLGKEFRSLHSKKC